MIGPSLGAIASFRAIGPCTALCNKTNQKYRFLECNCFYATRVQLFPSRRRYKIMSDEKLPSASLTSGTGDALEKDAGSEHIAEEDSKNEPDDDDVMNAAWVGDAPNEGPKEQDEEEESEAEEELTEKTSFEREEGENNAEKRKKEDDAEDKEDEEFISHEEEKSEDEEMEKTSSLLRTSPTAVLTITSLLEEILETVFRRVDGKEPEEGAEEKSEELEGEEIEDEERAEGEKVQREPSVRTISVTTIKSAATTASESSEERRVARQTEEQQLRKDRDAELRQQTFDENVRLFNQCVRERGELKRKNAYLARKMYEFYRLHKIGHLFKELPSGNQEMEARYVKALSKYDEMKNSADIEEGKANALIDLLTAKHEEVAAVMQEELAALAAREREVGDGLVFTLTSKTLQDKALDKVIEQQLAKCAQVDEFRVKFFILRDAISEDESQLQALEDIGEGCTMKEYDQLRLRNQGCTEKLEEKDSELEKLRTKALSAMQIFTEVREAAFATAEDIESEERTLAGVERDLAETRERLGSEKKRRDLNRIDYVHLRQEAGLTAQPKLLRDYRRSKAELEKLEEEAAMFREKSEYQKHVMTTMRGTIKHKLSSVE